MLFEFMEQFLGVISTTGRLLKSFPSSFSSQRCVSSVVTDRPSRAFFSISSSVTMAKELPARMLTSIQACRLAALGSIAWTSCLRAASRATPSLGKRNLGVCAQCQLTLDTVYPVLDASKLAPFRIDKEVQPLCISHLIRFVLGLGIADRRVGQRHLGASHLMGAIEAPKLGPHLSRLLTDKGGY